jgi:hypothetical protein
MLQHIVKLIVKSFKTIGLYVDTYLPEDELLEVKICNYSVTS